MHRVQSRGNNLGDGSRGVIASEVARWATHIRWIGNDGAHAEKEPIAEEDAQDGIHIAGQFLGVLYVTPAIASEREARKKRQ